MEFSIKQSSPENQRSACIVLGVFEGGQLSPAAQILDQAAGHQLSKLVTRGDVTGKTGNTVLLHTLSGVSAERVLLIGLGKAEEFNAKQFLDTLRTTFAVLQKTICKDAALYFTDLAVQQRDEAWKINQIVLLAAESAYRCDQLKSKPADKPSLRKVLLGCTKKPGNAAQTALLQASATAHGMKLTKDLGNLPGNICTPTYLAEQARKLAETYKFKVTVLEEKDMEKLGMHSLLSVTRGSRQPAKLITLEYHGGDKKQKPVVLVGKGLTFDSGGVSLKPGASMDEMKYDMCGAASVLGTMQAIAEMGLKLNVVAVIPSSENMPDGAASKPGDIVKSMAGLTIEILNTDAEGRLILCDALTYAARFEPDTVLDIATLTGACVIALGGVASGLFSNQDELARELAEAGEYSNDRAWHMPLWDDYQQQLDSNFADMQNIGGREAGSITAACFLSRFTKNYRWAHLDIAGTAWKSGKDKGSTGRPVPLLTRYLIQRAQAAK
ncbi:MAG: leucyl aminopeptidase [Gallionella sp.]|nr:leucyl aminopeptidase [Gallionella sp.]MDP1939371.1 leucyl aminopeptidase [Gallionella sp.]